MPQIPADASLLPGESEARSYAAVPARRGRLSHGQVGEVMNHLEDNVTEDANINNTPTHPHHRLEPVVRVVTAQIAKQAAQLS